VEITPQMTIGTSLNYPRIESHLGTEAGISAKLGATCGHALVFTASRGFCLGFPPEVPWELYDNSDYTSRFTASGTLNYRMTDWLSHRLVLGMDDLSSDARTLERFASEELSQFLAPAMAAGRIGQTLRERRGFTIDYAGTATTDLREDITSATSVGLQMDRREARNSTLGGMGFPAPGVELIGATATRLDSSQSELVNTTLGAYVQQRMGYRDRLFLTGALRVDNNSAFGEDLRWVTYPKVDASWIVSEEEFWPLGDQVSTFRFRTAYGESGRAPSAFSALRTFSPVTGPGGTNAVTAGSLGNPNLKPERGREWEVGFEAILDRTWAKYLPGPYRLRQTLERVLADPEIKLLSRHVRFDAPVAGELIGFLPVFAPALAVALAGDAAVAGAGPARQSQRQCQVDPGGSGVYALGVLFRAPGGEDDRGLRGGQRPSGGLQLGHRDSGEPLHPGRPVAGGDPPPLLAAGGVPRPVVGVPPAVLKTRRNILMRLLSRPIWSGHG
jgi:hypothetical protein